MGVVHCGPCVNESVGGIGQNNEISNHRNFPSIYVEAYAQRKDGCVTVVQI